MDAGTRLTARRPYAKAPVEENCPVANSNLMPIGTGTRFAGSATSFKTCEHAKDYVNKNGLPAHLTKTVVETITNAAVTVNIQSVLPVAGREKPCGLPIRRRETQCPCAKHVKQRCPYAKAHVEENCPVVHSTEMPIDTGTRFAANANSQPV